MTRASHENLQALAKRLGVSVSTVSRVLNGKAEKFRISAATQERVLAAARKSGVVINQIARGLRLQTTLTIGLIIPDISNPFFASFARQVERCARSRGYSVLLADSQEKTDVEMESVQLMLSRHVDGLVIAPVGQDSGHLAGICKDGTPLVLADRVFPDLPVASVTANNFEGARAAVLHLAARGHTAIACVQGFSESYANGQRVEGYRQGLKDAGLRFNPRWLAGQDYAVESGHAAVLELFAGRPGPTAILALGNLIALGALTALRELHLRVPEDVSIISFDEQPWAKLLAPAITTVSQPIERMGEEAMQLLFAQLGSGSREFKSPKVVLPVSLIQRESVASR